MGPSFSSDLTEELVWERMLRLDCGRWGGVLGEICEFCFLLPPKCLTVAPLIPPHPSFKQSSTDCWRRYRGLRGMGSQWRVLRMAQSAVSQAGTVQGWAG